MGALWALTPRWLKIGAGVAVLLAGGAYWVYGRGYSAGAISERLAANDEAVRAAVKTRADAAKAVADAFDRGKAAAKTGAALRDSVRVVDTLTLTIPGPGLTPVRVTVPAIVIRRIVADSAELASKEAKVQTLTVQVVADSGVINALTTEVQTLKAAKTAPCGAKCQVVKVAAVTLVVGEAAVRIAALFRRR